MDLNRQVDPSCDKFTLAFVVDLLRQHNPQWDETRKLCGVDCALMEAGGFMSDLYRITFHFSGGAADETVIFKVPTTRRLNNECHYDEANLKKFTAFMFHIHNAEVRFYTEVAPLIRSRLSVRLPQMYAACKSPALDTLSGGFLLMEDIAAGALPVPLLQGLSRAQAEAAIRALAQLHALTLDLPEGLVASFTMRQNMDLEEEALKVSDRLVALPDCPYFKDNEQALRRLYAQHSHAAPDKHELFGTRPVLSHGDYWLSNLFFRQQAPDEVDAIFDWQCCYASTGVNDAVRMLYISVEPEVRGDMDAWLSLYYGALTGALERMGAADKNPYANGMADVRRIHVYDRHYELCFALFLYANVLGGLTAQGDREKVLRRMIALFEEHK